MKTNLARNIWRYFFIFAIMAIASFIKPVTVEASDYTVIEVTEDDIKAHSNGAYGAIQDALDEARDKATTANPYKIIVYGDEYTLNNSLHIYSNTYLDTSEVTLIQGNSGTNMIVTGRSTDDSQVGYCYKNITIDGGIWDQNGYGHTLIKIAHASNVTVKNCTFQNCKNAHTMEVAGVNGLSILGCTFQDQTLTTNADVFTCEAIQIDILEQSHFNSYTYEDLATKNVVIDSCDFFDVPRGVGSHTAILNNPVDGISITNCNFSNCSSCAIQGMNWVNCTISGNTIIGCSRGIALYSIRKSGTFLSSTIASEGGLAAVSSTKYQTPASNQNIVITNNSIGCSGTDPYGDYVSVGILVSGYLTSDSSGNDTSDEDSTGDTIPSGNYYISGVTISNNEIDVTGHGIRLYDTRNATISNNEIDGASSSGSTAYYGIQLVTNSTGVSITNNEITDFSANGIYAALSSSATTISGNEIEDTGKYGIDIEGSTATTITQNKISNTENNGIYVYNGATVTTISSNTISDSGKHGIDVESSTVTTIDSNTISSPTSNGIYIYKSSTATTISNNSISSAGKYGIDVEGSTAGTIKKNTISKPKTNGIYIYNSAKVTSSITSNTITSAGKYGIDVEKSTVKTISSNTISKPKTNGIYIYNSSKVTSKISSNTISSAGKYGIDVEKSTVKTISSNTISKAKTNGIFVYNSGKVTTISSNKITSPGKYGIGVDGGTATTIKSNTISKPTNHGIFVQNSGKVKTIKSNKITSGKARGISINSLKCDLTISSNTISKCAKDAEIFLAPNTTSYTITVKSNKITGKSTVDGIYAGSKCKVSISGNTIKSANKAINLTTKVKGTVYKNTFSSNKSNKVTYGSKTYSNLSKPSSVKASKASSTSIKISWKEVSNASGYYIYRSTSKDGTYKKVATVSGGSKTSYTNKSLKSGKTYYYKVVAYTKTSNGNVVIRSSYSSVVSKKL